MSQLSPAVCVQVRLFTADRAGGLLALPSPKRAWWKALSALKALLNWQAEVVGGVKAEQCATTMTEFFAARRAGKKKLKKASPAAD